MDIIRVVWVVFSVFIAVVHSNEGPEGPRQYDPTSSLGIEGLAFNSTDNETMADISVSLSQTPFILTFMEHTTVIDVNYTITCYTPETLYRIHVSTSDPLVAFLEQPDVFNASCNNASNFILNETHPLTDVPIVTGTISLTLKADLLGRSWLIFENEDIGPGHEETRAKTESNSTTEVNNGQFYRHLVVVIRVPRAMDQWVQAFVYVFVICSTIGMGCNTDLVIVKEVLKKPIAPIIGFFCQYLAMPLIAFGVAKVVTFENPAVALGIFACGTCPGGGPSNIYSYLLGGDLSLSVTMTTISTIAALGMVPLWIFTLGNQFKDDKMQITIPYLSIVQTLATVILPLMVGVIIRYKCERVSKIITKIIKPVTLITIVVLLTVGIYANLYIFRLFKPATILAGCMLPYIGYVIGGVIALICRQPWYRVKTIAIETGIQNVLVAYLILLLALPPPDGDLAAVGPAASACMTPLPLFVLAIGYTIYLKCTNQSYAQVAMKDRNDATKSERNPDQENNIAENNIAENNIAENEDRKVEEMKML